MNSEISVAITGKDTLSPALTAVEERLARSRIALNASGAVADQFKQKIAALHGQFATGEIGAIEYDKSLAKLERQFRSSSEAVTAFQTRTATGVGVSNAFVANTDRMARGAQRAAFGIQSMSVALQGGRVNAQGFLGAVGMMGLGSPWFLAVSAGLSVVGSLILGIGDKSEEAAARTTAAFGNTLSTMRGFTRQMQEDALRSTEMMLEALPAVPTGTRTETWERAGEMFTRQVPAEDPHAAERARLQEILEQQRRAIALARGQAKRATSGRQVKRDDPGAFFAPPRDLRTGPDFGSPGGKDRDTQSAADLFGSVAKVDPAIEALTRLRGELKSTKDDLKSVGESALGVGTAFSAGFGAAIDAVANGANVFQAFTQGVLGALAREAKGRAVFEAASGFSALGRGLFFHDPKAMAASGAHFQAAALFGAAAVGASALAGGGGRGAGGGGGGGFGRTSSDPRADRGTTPANQPVIIIENYINGQPVGRLVTQVNREGELGGSRLSVQRVHSQLPGTVTVARG